MKKYSKPFDWPAYCSKEDVERNVKFILKFNEELVNECKKYGFNLINTKRGEERNKVINELAKQISETM